MADLEQIEVVLAKLQSNYSEFARTFYTLFYDPEPQDITLKWYDEDGTLQTLTIPNRAKDFNLVKNGQTNPEGIVSAPQATVFQNTKNGEIYLKQSGTGTSGWVKIISEADLENFVIHGQGAPNHNLTGKLGTLYVDTTNGVLYIKSLPTGNVGWQAIIDVADSRFAHFLDLGITATINIDLP